MGAGHRSRTRERGIVLEWRLAVRHLAGSRAQTVSTTAQVTVTRDVDVLLAEIVDDGRGGVDESMGTGIAGMRRRLEALDGTLKVTSPVGGPTRIGLEVSCAS